jgi:two-component system sensor histidine kinase PilS (NtrC family)
MTELRNESSKPMSATLPAQQSATLLRIYTWYRLALVTVLIAVLLFSRKDPLVGQGDPELFVALCGAYFLGALLLLIVLPVIKRLSKRLLFANFFADIGVLIALSHISGGTAGGISLLLLVCVAASGLILSGQLALLIAALASIALLGDTLYQLAANPTANQSLVAAGLQGMLLFATSIGFQVLSQRLRTSQQLAIERAADVSKLQNLNQLIVQRMRTGILVVDSDSKIKMMNEAAAELLHAQHVQQQLSQDSNPPLFDSLRHRYDAWKNNSATPARVFRVVDTGPDLIARFTALDYEQSGDTLIFVEDSGQLAQRAQQLKLAALGRLTASIAHEIRNPLGAISHAGQLLRESPHLDDSDTRLIDIVLNHSRRINSIIENVLQLSRRSPPNPRRLNLSEWLHIFIEEYQQGLSAHAQITIRELQNVEITVDPEQLEQVLTNLLDNALRYSQKSIGIASAELIITTDRHQLPELDVVDEGPGIATRDQEKVFEPFFTTESKGNGLGLYISRELCEINQARLHYLRTEQGKSCFRISFSHPDRKPLISE